MNPNESPTTLQEKGGHKMTSTLRRKCSFEDCTESATNLACGRYWTQYNTKKGHPTPAWYCEKHADEVAEESDPEYTENCPNCGCRFGVN